MCLDEGARVSSRSRTENCIFVFVFDSFSVFIFRMFSSLSLSYLLCFVFWTFKQSLFFFFTQLVIFIIREKMKNATLQNNLTFPAMVVRASAFVRYTLNIQVSSCTTRQFVDSSTSTASFSSLAMLRLLQVL